MLQPGWMSRWAGGLDEPEDPDVIVLSGEPPEKVTAYLVRAFIGAFIGLALSTAFIQCVLGTVPKEHLVVWVAGAALGLVVAVVRGPRFGCRRIDIRGDRLVLSGPEGQEEVLASDVEVLAGQKRISLDGGELLVWKIIRLATFERQFVFHVAPEDAGAYFNFLTEVCRQAVALEPGGAIMLPSKDADVPLRQWFEESRHRARKGLIHMAVRQAGLAAACLAAGVGLAIVGGLQGGKDPADSGGPLVLVYAIVALVLGVILAANALRLVLTMGRTARMLESRECRNEWADRDSLPRIRIGPGEEAAPARARASAPPKVLAVAALPLFWVPVIGLLLAWPAWRGLRGTTSRLRSPARKMVILATIITLTVAGSAILAIFLR